MRCSHSRPIDERTSWIASLEGKLPLKATRRTAHRKAHSDRFIDLGLEQQPEHRVLSITHVGRYHAVLTQPPDRRTDELDRLPR